MGRGDTTRKWQSEFKPSSALCLDAQKTSRRLRVSGDITQKKGNLFLKSRNKNITPKVSRTHTYTETAAE